MRFWHRLDCAADWRGDEMKYPCLVPKRLCRTKIELTIEQEGVNKYGEPLNSYAYTGMCNYQDKAKVVYTEEKKKVQITGTAIFPGDICPELPVISCGHAVVFGKIRQIAQGTKARNPDGSVNFTEVQLI